jgi:hypothetical protein
MTHSFDIRFEPPHLDRVTFALAPFDAYSGRLVSEGIDASVVGLPNRPIRNRSGLLVFVNLPARPIYKVDVRASAAGYFDPPQQDVVPVADSDPERATKRRKNVPLMPLPQSDFPEASSLLRGVVVRGGLPVDQAGIELDASAHIAGFATKTASSGAFALPIRMKRDGMVDGDRITAAATFKVKDNSGEMTLTHDVRSGATYRFAAPIDLANLTPIELIEI